jgi:hypothetical protein
MFLGVSLPIVVFEVLAYACLGLCIWHVLKQVTVRDWLNVGLSSAPLNASRTSQHRRNLGNVPPDASDPSTLTGCPFLKKARDPFLLAMVQRFAPPDNMGIRPAYSTSLACTSEAQASGAPRYASHTGHRLSLDKRPESEYTSVYDIDQQPIY